MRKMITTLLACIVASQAHADQLSLNSPSVTKMATEVIRPYSILVTYCSECNDVSVEVWRVLRSLPVPGEKPVSDRSRTFVIAERIFVTDRPYGKGRYSPSMNFRRILASSPLHERVMADYVDLAYVYVSTGDNRFRCLGKQLKLECTVDVEEIVLPEDVFGAIVEYLGPEEDYRGNRYVPRYDVTGKRM